MQDCNATIIVQICFEDPEEDNEEKLIGHFKHEEIKLTDYIIYIDNVKYINILWMFIIKIYFMNRIINRLFKISVKIINILINLLLILTIPDFI